MKIKTKYSIGDTVWFIHENQVHQGIVSFISVDIRSDGECVEKYTMAHSLNGMAIARHYVERVFPTKEALLKSL